MIKEVNSENVFTIHYTPEYIRQVTGLEIPECKRVLFWLSQFYDEDKGITRDYLNNLAKGIKGGLL